MEPFVVVCKSCQSRIRIRNSKLIGQQVACPKCAAQVLITVGGPPKIQVAANDAPPIDSTAMTKDALTSVSMEAPGVETWAAEENSLAPTQGNFANIDFDDVDDILGQPAAFPEHNPYASTPSWVPTEKAAPTEQWSSQSSARGRQYLLVGFLGLAGCILAGVTFVFFLRWYHQPTVALQPQTTDSPTEANQTAPDPTNPIQAVEPQEPTEGPESPAEPAAAQQTTVSIDPVTVASESGLPTSAATVEPNEPSKEPATTVDATAVKTSDNQTVEPGEGQSAEEMPEQLSELLNALGESYVVSNPPKLIVPEQPVVTEAELGAASSSGLIAPVAKLNELAAERQVRGFKLSGVTLPAALSAWNTVVGLPAMIDPKHLAAANVDLTTKFNIEIQNAVAAEAIKSFAAAMNLTAVAHENRFWLLEPATPDATLLPWKLKVDDLVQGAEQEQWLIESIELLYPDSVGSISIIGGELAGKTDSIDRITWFAIARVLENWRIARGLPPALTGYSRENLVVPFITAPNVKAFEFESSEVTESPRPFAWLLNHFCSQAGLTCWVDWQAIEYLPIRMGYQSITPQMPIISITHQRPIMSLLDEYDFEFHIATLIINEKTVWLTSQYAYRRVPEVFVLPRNDKDLDGYWRQYLRPLTPIDSAGVSNVVLRETPDGQFIFAKCCWPTLGFQ